MGIGSHLLGQVGREAVHDQNAGTIDMLIKMIQIFFHIRNIHSLHSLFTRCRAAATRFRGVAHLPFDEKGWDPGTIADQSRCHRIAVAIASLLHDSVSTNKYRMNNRKKKRKRNISFRGGGEKKGGRGKPLPHDQHENGEK